MLYNILKDQWQTIEIDRIRSITQETEFSQMAELLYDYHTTKTIKNILIHKNYNYTGRDYTTTRIKIIHTKTAPPSIV